MPGSDVEKMREKTGDSKRIIAGKTFGEFMSKRKCLKEFDRIGKVLGNA